MGRWRKFWSRSSKKWKAFSGIQKMHEKTSAKQREHEADLTRQSMAEQQFQEQVPAARQQMEEELAAKGVSTSSAAGYLRRMQEAAFQRKETGLELGRESIYNQSAIERGNKAEANLKLLAAGIQSLTFPGVASYFSDAIGITGGKPPVPMLSLTKPMTGSRTGGYGYGTGATDWSLTGLE